MNGEDAILLARAVLRMETDVGLRMDDDGVEAKAMSLAFSTGIEVTTNGEKWTPSPQHLIPGMANFKFAREALEQGNLIFLSTNLTRLTKEAGTDKAAYDACKLILKTNLKNFATIPPQLARWASSDPVRVRKGAHKNKPRDHAISLAVYWLVQQGLSATRNDASFEKDSACDYVSEALIREGVGCSFSAVKAVWNNYKHEFLARDMP